MNGPPNLAVVTEVYAVQFVDAIQPEEADCCRQVAALGGLIRQVTALGGLIRKVTALSGLTGQVTVLGSFTRQVAALGGIIRQVLLFRSPILTAILLILYSSSEPCMHIAQVESPSLPHGVHSLMARIPPNLLCECHSQ